MKQLLLIALMLIGINVYSQNAIKYDYDAAGNMTQKYIQVINMRVAKKEQLKDSLLDFKIYPNPTKDQITIEGALYKNSKEAKISIYNINGALVMSDTYSGFKKTIQLSNFNSGIYFLEIKYSRERANNYRIVITQ
jgi:hypothetical protein